MTQTTLEERVRVAVGGKVPGVALVVVGAEGVRARSAVGLAERGLLELDAPVLPLVPAIDALRPAAWAQRITPRHLLQHSAGRANPIPVRWIHRADGPGPDADQLLTGFLSRRARLRFPPGARSSYSNLGALTLGAMIASAGHARFEAVLRHEVLEPEGMVATGFSYIEGQPAATGYHPRRSPMRLLLPRWVAGLPSGRWVGFRRFLLDGAAYGGLVGTAEDAARFLRMHLRDGELDGTWVLSAAAAAAMRRIDLQGRRFDLGLGWFVPATQRDADPPFVEHLVSRVTDSPHIRGSEPAGQRTESCPRASTNQRLGTLGGGAGFFNVMRLYPSLGLGAIVMGNATRYDVDAVARLALAFRS